MCVYRNPKAAETMRFYSFLQVLLQTPLDTQVTAQRKRLEETSHRGSGKEEGSICHCQKRNTKLHLPCFPTEQNLQAAKAKTVNFGTLMAFLCRLNVVEGRVKENSIFLGRGRKFPLTQTFRALTLCNKKCFPT